MSKKREVEEDGEEQQIDLTVLLAHSRQLDENINAQQAEENRLAAMQEFGLVEPKAVPKSGKVDDKLKAENENLKTELDEANQKVADLETSLLERDEQIRVLTEALEAKAESDTGDTGDTTTDPKVPPVVTGAAKPWDKA